MRRDDIQFPAKHSALRDDVHVLGALVGDVLKEQGGDTLVISGTPSALALAEEKLLAG